MNWFDIIACYIIQNFCRAFTALTGALLYRIEYINKHNVPKKGGCVIASNHSSYIDPPLIANAIFYRIFRFMAKDALFKSLIYGTLLRSMGAFPIKREGIDRKSWDTFVQLVNNGQCVILFPEGTRTPNGKIQQGKLGTGMLIHRAKAKVIPVYIHGAFDAWPRGKSFPVFFKKIIVIYGSPIDFAEYFNTKGNKEIYQKITEKIMDDIKELKNYVLARSEVEKK